jgi:hypothetical protein
VIACGSSAAREAAGNKDYPSDLTIVGIIDYGTRGARERSRPPGLRAVMSSPGTRTTL